MDTLVQTENKVPFKLTILIDFYLSRVYFVGVCSTVQQKFKVPPNRVFIRSRGSAALPNRIRPCQIKFQLEVETFWVALSFEKHCVLGRNRFESIFPGITGGILAVAVSRDSDVSQ